MIRLLLAVATFGAAADIAQAPSGKPSDAPASSQPATKPGHGRPVEGERRKLICEEQQETGSFIPTRVCATREEWEERRRHDSATNQQMRDQSGFCDPAAGNC